MDSVGRKEVGTIKLPAPPPLLPIRKHANCLVSLYTSEESSARESGPVGEGLVVGVEHLSREVRARDDNGVCGAEAERDDGPVFVREVREILIHGLSCEEDIR